MSKYLENSVMGGIRMRFGESFITFWKRSFDFKGRATRSEFWYTFLWIFIVYIPLQMVSTYAVIVLELIIFIPVLSQLVRRARDAGISKYVILPLVVVNIVMMILSLRPGYFEDEHFTGIDLLSFAVLVVVFIVGMKKSIK